MSDDYVIDFGTQTIEYKLILLPRQTLAITVEPDLSVVVKAPEGSNLTKVQELVQKRAGWIRKQQRQYEIFLSDLPPRQYLSGEGYRFLGRQYRLKVREIQRDEIERVELARQFLYVSVYDKSPDHVRRLVEGWYREQAQNIFCDRLISLYPKVAHFEIPYPKIAVRRMPSSWGSCSKNGLISLNIKLIQVPKEYIDYVILHELCHLKEHNHTTNFKNLLSSILPNWKEYKARLDRFDFG
jgi:predicted metal-dependent hydrolase